MTSNLASLQIDLLMKRQSQIRTPTFLSVVRTVSHFVSVANLFHLQTPKALILSNCAVLIILKMSFKSLITYIQI